MKVGDLVKPKPRSYEGEHVNFSEGHPQNYIGLVINTDHRSQGSRLYYRS